jgi:sensor histidine kinase regulating citrate/malate metabolism
MVTVHLEPPLSVINARFKQHQAGLLVQVDAIAEELAQSIAEAAFDLVPTDTYRTQESIRVERRGAEYVVVVDRKGERDEVPIYLEIGTYKMAARPFLVPASNLVLAAAGTRRAATKVGGLLPPTR